MGIIFITQTPKDIPDDVLAQLGSKVQHALRAHTPNEAKKLRETVGTFPTSPLDLEELAVNLGAGEAIVTVPGKEDSPSPVSSVRIWTPASAMRMAMTQNIQLSVINSPTRARYKNPKEPKTAFDLLEIRRKEKEARQAELAQAAEKAKAERMQELERQAREAEKIAIGVATLRPRQKTNVGVTALASLRCFATRGKMPRGKSVRSSARAPDKRWYRVPSRSSQMQNGLYLGAPHACASSLKGPCDDRGELRTALRYFW